MTYDVLLSDPAWAYSNKTIRGGAAKHYKTMTPEAIALLDVQGVTASDAACFLWVPSPLLGLGFYLFRNWGFRYKTVAFNWLKLTKDGSETKMGPGFYTRAESELCLLGIRGSMPVDDKSIRQVIEAPLREHSRKPEEQYDRIRALYPEARKLEMFARPPVPEDFDTWGDAVVISRGAEPLTAIC